MDAKAPLPQAILDIGCAAYRAVDGDRQEVLVARRYLILPCVRVVQMTGCSFH
jgi:hypothetical protein